MLTDDTEIRSPTALVYETAQEARLLLAGASDDELLAAGRAASEAGYYLSDTIEPAERMSLVDAAEARMREEGGGEKGDLEARTTAALTLLNRAAGEVQQLLRGPNASSELRIGLRALHRAIAGLAGYAGLATDQVNLHGRRGPGMGALRRGRSQRGQPLR